MYAWTGTTWRSEALTVTLDIPKNAGIDLPVLFLAAINKPPLVTFNAERQRLAGRDTVHRSDHVLYEVTDERSLDPGNQTLEGCERIRLAATRRW